MGHFFFRTVKVPLSKSCVKVPIPFIYILFSYGDTQRYRLGANFNQLPINCPLQAYNPFQRDGPATINGNYGSVSNYPSSSEPLKYRADVNQSEAHEEWIGTATSFHWGATDKDYHQAHELWKVFERTGQQEAFIHNISQDLKNARPDIQDRVFEMFTKVSPEISSRIKESTLQYSPRK